MRWLAAIALGTAFAFSLSFAMSSEAEAQKRGRGAKMCSTNSMITGKKMSWRCGATQRCCYNGFTDKGYCSSGSACL